MITCMDGVVIAKVDERNRYRIVNYPSVICHMCDNKPIKREIKLNNKGLIN